MPDLMACLATPVPFRAWLMRQSSSLVVGMPQSPDQCPLARFLRAVGYGEVLVGRQEVSVQERLFPLPLWAVHFIHQVDVGRIKATALRRREALHFLANAGGTLVA
jgi:hypothetical protein